MDCASFDADLDPLNGAAGKVGIGAVRARSAHTPEDAGPLIFSTGSDLPSSLQLPVWLSRAGADVLNTHPIVAVDRRGMGMSSAVDCRDTLERQDMWDQAQFDVGDDPVANLGTVTVSATTNCTDIISPGDSAYDNAHAAEDIEALRSIWDVPEIALMGVGNGAQVALAYAGSHPTKLARLVLDSPVPLDVAAEAADAGAERLVIVTSEGKDSVVAHFVEDLVLEGTLEARGKKAMLAKVRRAPQLIKVESVVQAEPLGLGHAIGCVEPTLADDEDSVAVLLPDDLVLPTGVLETMSKVRAHRGGTVLCAIEVTPEEVSAYGVFDVEPVPDSDNPDVLKVVGMVEKPKAEDAPSMYAAAGRYVLDRAVFDALRRIDRGAGGEVQITDAIALLISEGHPVHVVVHRGSRHDLGNPGGYLKAAVDFALDRDDYGPELRRWLVARLGLTED
ncbi:UTP--glucose-1-phosphate uridylyltransferase [Mycobacterium talmoniae]|uniref:UTP--glucose-1-phosphate uridylyltransferase n=1 Tax=Mycobacterium talmoniae TaxID=1858794 RepID=A0A2S8BQJ8_9MYCO|nr:UTP--glucose-1-phosphate uridylyltransferase [Mycobacterium talmoniae]